MEKNNSKILVAVLALVIGVVVGYSVNGNNAKVADTQQGAARTSQVSKNVLSQETAIPITLSVGTGSGNRIWAAGSCHMFFYTGGNNWTTYPGMTNSTSWNLSGGYNGPTSAVYDIGGGWRVECAE